MSLPTDNERSPNDSPSPLGSQAPDAGLTELRLRLASDTASLGFFVWNSRPNAISWENEITRRLLGRSSTEETISLSRFEAEVIHQADAKLFRQSLGSGLSTGRLTFVGRFRHKDGQFRWLEWEGRSVDDGAGLTDRVVGVIADLTEQRRSQAAAWTSDVQRRLMIDSVPALIAYIDRDLRYVSGNETYRTWFGRDPDSLQGVPVVDVLGRETTLRIKPFMERALRGERQEFEEAFPGLEGPIRLV